MFINQIPHSAKSYLTGCVLFCAALLMLNAPALLAQETMVVPASTEVEQIIATLEDEKKRAELLAQLRLLNTVTQSVEKPQDSSPGADLMREVSKWVHGASAAVFRSLNTLTTLPTALSELGSRVLATERATDWLAVAAKIFGVLLSAWLVYMLVRRLLVRQRSALEGSAPETWLAKLSIQVGRAILELLAIAALAITAYVLLSLLGFSETPQLLTMAIINITLLTRVVMIFARIIFSPNFGDLRLIPVSDESANYWFLWIRRLSVVSVYGYILVETIFLLGLPGILHDVLINLLGLVVLLMLIIVIQQNRRDVAEKLAGAQSSTKLVSVLRRQFAAFWNLFAVLYLIFIYAVWAASIPGGFSLIWVDSALSLLVVVIATGIGYGLHRGIDRGFSLSEELRARIPSLEERTNRYVPQLKVTASILVGAVAAISILKIWGIGVLGWFENDLVGDIGARLGNIVLILLIAYLVWEALSIAIEYGLARAREASGEHARMETLLPLAKKTARLVIATLVLMIGLSELGINIGPLLAAAGVLGLAVGFGAQTLVKDIITGVFILLENSISVGDFVEVGDHTGEVEKVSIRTIQLRDIEGSVHTVPFSSVSTVLNYTRDYGISKLEIGVAYRENVDHVIEVLNQIGAEMLEDPILSVDMLEPLEVQGVQSLADSAVIIRARIKTTAGKQWAMRRAFHRLVKLRFDELGIEIPFPHQTLYFGVDQKGQAPAAQVQLNPPKEG